MSVSSEYYLAMVDKCARDADESPLENVRDRCLRSEAAWRALAQRMLVAERSRAAEAAAKDARLK